MVKGEGILEIRDRAILRFYVFTGARIATGCKLKVNDFQQDGDESTIRFHLKGGRVRTKGINYQAAEAIQEYIAKGGLSSGPLFRPRSGSKGQKLAERQMTERTMNRLLMAYLERLPGSMQEVAMSNGEKVNQCIYSPHSLRATTATLLLDANEAIESVQELLDHKHITHNSDLRQAAAKRQGFGEPQGADLRTTALKKVPLLILLSKTHLARSGLGPATGIFVSKDCNTTRVRHHAD